MTILKLKGGLGNQMFQYATGLAYAIKNGSELRLDASGFDNTSPRSTAREFRLDRFSITAPIASPEEIKEAAYPYGVVSRAISLFKKRILKLRYLDYHPQLLRQKNLSYMEGYFQSEKNFVEIEKRVREEFTPKIQSDIFSNIKENLSKTNSVAVHIRRGDYVSDQRANAYHGTCSKGYYESAMRFMSENLQDPLFVFFSDDIEWTQREFGEQSNFLFINEPRLQDYEELLLMASCKHNIIANSSFSWWGAWLNDDPKKIIIAPKDWTLRKPNPHPNIIPSTWKTI